MMSLVFVLMMCVAFVWLVVSYSKSARRSVEPEPKYVPIEDAIRELEQWNTSWTHPELGSEFYHWDEQQKKYVEGSLSPADPHKPKNHTVTEGYIPSFKPEKQRDPVAGCRCDKLPEGMICSVCFFKNRS